MQLNYKDTLNLPQAKFKMKANLPQREPETQKFWEAKQIYTQMLKNKKASYILHDGPPYANGDIHLGQALNKVLKDIIVKYKALEGFSTPFVPGWDCHGLPVELQLFKKLNIKRKEEVDKLAFRKEAREFAFNYLKVQREQFKRLGVFGEFEKPYFTMDYSYQASIIEAFSQLYQKGYVYLGNKPIYWCIFCETALAEAEVEYEEHTSPSLWVKFRLKPSISGLQQPAYIVIWTTTPWTIPGNVAVALHPEYEYALVKTEVRSQKSEIWILAKELVDSTLQKLDIKDYEILKVKKGKDLQGWKYDHPLLDKEGRIVLADYVSLEEGTGCVHTAPGHGQEDYLTGVKYKLEVFSPVDEKGRFTSEVAEFAGKQIFQANPLVVEKLKEKGLLLGKESIQHSYPHCWRCKEPLIYRACRQWFIGVDKHGLREKALKSIKGVQWVPTLAEKRITAMVENRPDWCISRQRIWGVPIPAIYCIKCSQPIVDERIIEALIKEVKKEGVDIWFKKKAEEFLPADFSCPHCESKQGFSKEEDILDVWLDSGVSHKAVLKTSPQLNWPADLYLEGSDQHRGWFQTSLLTSMALYGQPPYKAVLTHGFVVDEEGKKMSKSKGNVTDPNVIVDKYGADILRLWVVSSDYQRDIRIGPEILERCIESYRKIRNTFRFLLGNLDDFKYPDDKVEKDEWLEVDQWAYQELQLLIGEVHQAYQEFKFSRVYRLLHNFAILQMSSLYLDILKDRLYILPADSLERKSAQTVLYAILRSFAQLIAPLLPHTAEEIWQAFDFAEDSVFLTSFPVKGEIDGKLENRWKRLLVLREEVCRMLEDKRQSGLIGSSLEAKVVFYGEESWQKFLRSFGDDLKFIFITSQVEIKELDEAPSGAEGNAQLPGIKIDIQKADGQKCLRCWNWDLGVGRNEKHPQLCPRCAKIVEEEN